MSLEVLVDQLEEALDTGFYFLALSTALTIPDIAGAISSDDGNATGKKYKEWYEQWVRPRFSLNEREYFKARGMVAPAEAENPFDGDACYYYRCAILHQARSTHRKSKFTRIMFIEPTSNPNVMHYAVIEEAPLIDLPSFCREVVEAYRDWVVSDQATANYVRKTKDTMQRYEHGLPPYISGVPVIS